MSAASSDVTPAAAVGGAGTLSATEEMVSLELMHWVCGAEPADLKAAITCRATTREAESSAASALAAAYTSALDLSPSTIARRLTLLREVGAGPGASTEEREYVALMAPVRDLRSRVRASCYATSGEHVRLDDVTVDAPSATAVDETVRVIDAADALGVDAALLAEWLPALRAAVVAAEPLGTRLADAYDAVLGEEPDWARDALRALQTTAKVTAYPHQPQQLSSLEAEYAALFLPLRAVRPLLAEAIPGSRTGDEVVSWLVRTAGATSSEYDDAPAGGAAAAAAASGSVSGAKRKRSAGAEPAATLSVSVYVAPAWCGMVGPTPIKLLDLDPRTTMAALKHRLAHETGMAVDRLLLYSSDYAASNDKQRLSALSPGCRHHLLLRELATPGLMHITALTLTDTMVPIATGPRDTVWVVKSKIEDSLGIPPDQQRLIYAGRQLHDTDLFWQHGVGHESTIHLVLRLRGD